MKPTKAYLKCPKCNRTVLTDHVDHLFMLLLDDEKYGCAGCDEVFDFASLSVCYKELGTDCDDCQFRFTCYSVRESSAI